MAIPKVRLINNQTNLVNMKISEKSAKWGGIMIAFACIVLFLGFWALMLEPIQNAYITKNLVNGTRNRPSAIVFGLLSGCVGFLFGAFTNVGFQLTKAKSFGIAYPDLGFNNILESKKFWIWSVLWAAAYIFVTLFWWRGQI